MRLEYSRHKTLYTGFNSLVSGDLSLPMVVHTAFLLAIEFLSLYKQRAYSSVRRLFLSVRSDIKEEEE
jgi:hypothetical protein